MLELEHVQRRFGDTVALADMSLAVARGSTVGFVGPNGSGKTTTMRIILGLLTPDAGAVRWDGVPLDAAFRRTVGYMPEERGLYPRMRVGDQLTWLARLHGLDGPAARHAADRWTERLGLAARRDDEVETLSLGNQQRVQLAAALVHDPQLLVLDEPFSGLDPTGVDALAAVLADRAAAGTAILFSSHQLELVERQCEAVVIIVEGRVHAAGPVQQLREARSGRRLRVGVEGAPPAWAGGLDGVTVVSTEGGTTVLELADGTDEDRVIDAARAAGRLRELTPTRASLAELYREAVQP